MLGIVPICVSAQRRGIVVSADNRLPLRDVAIRWDNNNDIVRSSWDGTFAIPADYRRVCFSHPKCETRSLRREEMTDTIYMLPSSRMLSEVIIYGARKRQPDYVGMNATDKKLVAVSTAGGANLLGVLRLLASPLINKIHRNKALKKERKKQILNNY